MRLHISHTTLLFNEYLSAMSSTPRIFIHYMAISEVLPFKILLAHDKTTSFRDLSWQELIGHASKVETI